MAKKKEQERSDITIEGNTALWDIRVEGDINGLYLGQFRFRCFLSPTQKLAASREYRELLGENPTLALKHDDDLAFSLTQLKYRVLSAPPFWSSTAQLGGYSGDIPDENVIMAVLDASIAAELKYATRLKQKKEDAIQKAKKAAERILAQRDEEVEEDESSDQTTGD